MQIQKDALWPLHPFKYGFRLSKVNNKTMRAIRLNQKIDPLIRLKIIGM